MEVRRHRPFSFFQICKFFGGFSAWLAQYLGLLNQQLSSSIENVHLGGVTWLLWRDKNCKWRLLPLARAPHLHKPLKTNQTQLSIPYLSFSSQRASQWGRGREARGCVRRRGARSPVFFFQRFHNHFSNVKMLDIESQRLEVEAKDYNHPNPIFHKVKPILDPPHQRWLCFNSNITLDKKIFLASQDAQEVILDTESLRVQ